MCGSARLDLDPVLACGVKPLAYFDQNDYGLGPGPWARDKVAEVRSIKGTGLPVEQVVAERPDLLVTNSYLVEDSRDELQKVMPVLSPGTGTAAADGWSTALDQVAQALAAEDVAREHRRQVDARLDALAGEVASLKSLRVATIYGYNGSFGQEARGSGTYAVVLLVADWSSNPEDKTTAQLLASPLFRRLPAVQAGRVVPLEQETTVGAYMLTALSIVPVAEQMAAAVKRAATGNGGV